MLRICRTASSITRFRSPPVVRRIGMYRVPFVACASSNSFSACRIFPWIPDQELFVWCFDQIGVMPRSRHAMRSTPSHRPNFACTRMYRPADV